MVRITMKSYDDPPGSDAQESSAVIHCLVHLPPVVFGIDLQPPPGGSKSLTTHDKNTERVPPSNSIGLRGNGSVIQQLLFRKPGESKSFEAVTVQDGTFVEFLLSAAA